MTGKFAALRERGHRRLGCVVPFRPGPPWYFPEGVDGGGGCERVCNETAMKLFRAFFIGVVVVVGLFLPGCAAFVPVPAPPPKMKPPFPYEALGVRNSCFVESVHFYDVYTAWKAGGDASWARVLQWGNQEGDYKISTGHAVAVYVEGGKVCGYDINFGFWAIDVPVEKHADVTEVGPKVFAHYPKFKPVFARYREDFPQPRPAKPPEFLFYHKNPDVRDATRVASELGRYRPVSVVEFSFLDKGVRQTSAGTIFVYGGRLCIYFPSKGTHISKLLVRVLPDLRPASTVIERVYPGAMDIKTQPGGYWFFPPKT